VTVIAEMPQSGKEVEAGVLNDFPNFCVFFAEDCHQGKEEGYPSRCWRRKAYRDRVVSGGLEATQRRISGPEIRTRKL